MLIKNIDIYGTQLGFTIQTQSRFKSTLGGVFTIFTVIIYVILFIFLAKDYYLRINPKVTFEKVYNVDSSLINYTITNDTFLFAIQSPVNFRDPKLYKLSLYYLTMENNLHYSTKLDFISCNKTSYSKIFKRINQELYCIDFNKILNMNITDTYNLAKIQNFLLLGIDYDYEYINTLNETYKQSVLDSEESFIYYLPDFSFSPNNYKNPFAIQLNIQGFSLNQNQYYSNSIKYAETVFEQDEHFLFEKKSEIRSKIHLQHQEEMYLIRDKKPSSLGTFIFNLDGLYNNKYTRVYKKCPEILAEISGIMDPLMIFFTIFLEYFSKYNFDNFIINNFLCYFKNENVKDNKLNGKYQNYKDFKNLFNKISPDNKYKIESIPNNKNSIKNRNSYYIKEKLRDLNLLPKNRKQEYSENILINNDLSINRSLLHIDRKTINKKNFIKDINIELLHKFNKDRNNNKIKIDKKDDNNDNILDYFGFYVKLKSNFPYITFIEYYFPFLIIKKNNDFNKRMLLTRTLKFLSQEILIKMDLFYYLKLARTTGLLKNFNLREKIEKEKLQFLLKSLYFVRDCDIESFAFQKINN